MKGLSANQLKLLAIIAMTADHIAFVFLIPTVPLYYILRTFGRLTAPLMSYFIVEGFHHTRDRKKYLMRTSLFALISQSFYFIMVFGTPPVSLLEFATNWNVMYTFSLSIIILMIVDNQKLKWDKKAILIIICFAFSDLGDWSYIISAWVLLLFLFRNSKKKKTLAFIGVSTILVTYKFLPMFDSFVEFSYQYGTLLALIPLHFYNGKRSSQTEKKKSNSISKYFFYIYYPLHMVLIILLKIVLLYLTNTFKL